MPGVCLLWVHLYFFGRLLKWSIFFCALVIGFYFEVVFIVMVFFINKEHLHLGFPHFWGWLPLWCLIVGLSSFLGVWFGSVTLEIWSHLCLSILVTKNFYTHYPYHGGGTDSVGGKGLLNPPPPLRNQSWSELRPHVAIDIGINVELTCKNFDSYLRNWPRFWYFKIWGKWDFMKKNQSLGARS